jgi:hypothetical protein
MTNTATIILKKENRVSKSQSPQPQKITNAQNKNKKILVLRILLFIILSSASVI